MDKKYSRVYREIMRSKCGSASTSGSTHRMLGRHQLNVGIQITSLLLACVQTRSVARHILCITGRARNVPKGFGWKRKVRNDADVSAFV